MKKLMFGLLIGLLCIATIAGSTGVLAYVEGPIMPPQGIINPIDLAYIEAPIMPPQGIINPIDFAYVEAPIMPPQSIININA